mgnify:CR=1 FL=1
MTNEFQKTLDAVRVLSLKDLDASSDEDIWAEFVAEGIDPDQLATSIAVSLDDVLAASLRQQAAASKVAMQVRAVPKKSLGLTLDLIKKRIAQAFEAVILDLTLPDSPRPETIERMRAVAALWPPIVVATGHDSAAVQMDCMWAGASDWMPKELAISAPAQFLARLIHAIIRPQARAKIDGHATH